MSINKGQGKETTEVVRIGRETNLMTSLGFRDNKEIKLNNARNEKLGILVREKCRRH